MSAENVVVMIAAALVVIRAGCFLNRMRAKNVPQRCILAVLALGVGALGVFMAPLWWSIDYEWQQALFSVGVAAYVWLDRRTPIERRDDAAI